MVLRLPSECTVEVFCLFPLFALDTDRWIMTRVLHMSNTLTSSESFVSGHFELFLNVTR